jgi:hypothetical protein
MSAVDGAALKPVPSGLSTKIEEPEPAVPHEGVAREGGAVGVDEVGAELEEVADEAGPAGPALEPEEVRRGGCGGVIGSVAS